MLDILKFLFSDFWVWLGFTVWIGLFGTAITQARGLFLYKIGR